MENSVVGSKVEVVRGVPVPLSAIMDIKADPETEAKGAAILEEASIENIFMKAFCGNDTRLL